MVEATLAQENLDELHGRLSGCFARVEPLQQARKYVTGLMSDLPRKNCWTLAEHAGDRTPDRMQRLLNDAVWDTTAAMGVIRRFVAEHLAPPAGGLAVAALDETGQEKKGNSTAGVKRQYMGCAGQVANGVNTVHCSYATRSGHALIGARLYLPAEQLDDPDRRAALGIPTDVVFRTKPQLAIDIITDAVADQTMPPWCAGDEVYGRSGQLRRHLQDHQIGYVLRVGCAFTVELNPVTRLRVDTLAATHLAATGLADRDRSRIQRRAQLRLGMAGHRQPAALPAHPPPPPVRRAGLPLLLRPTRAARHAGHPGRGGLPALAGRGGLRVRQGPLRARPLPGPPLHRPAAPHRAGHGRPRRLRGHRRRSGHPPPATAPCPTGPTSHHPPIPG